MRETSPSRLRDLGWAIRSVGLGGLWRLLRAYRLGWGSILTGFYKARVIQALFNVGFIDELQRRGTVSAESFAAAHHLDARVLSILCDTLYAHHLLDKSAAGYALGAQGRLLAEAGRGWFIATYGYEGVYHSLEALLRGEQRYGQDVRRREAVVTRGYGEIGALLHFPLMVDLVARHGYRRVLDLGCGDGSFLLTLCEANASVTGLGVDISAEAVACAEERARAAGLGSRVRFVAADIADLGTAAAGAPAPDVATAFFVLHDLVEGGTGRLVELLRSFRARFPGVPLVAFEVVRPDLEELRRQPGMSVHYFLYHDLTQQRPMTREQWRDVFRAAGFESVVERYLRFARTTVYTLT